MQIHDMATIRRLLGPLSGVFLPAYARVEALKSGKMPLAQVHCMRRVLMPLGELSSAMRESLVNYTITVRVGAAQIHGCRKRGWRMQQPAQDMSWGNVNDGAP